MQEEYRPRGKHHAIAHITLGPSKDFRYAIQSDVHVLLHRQTAFDTSMRCRLVAEQSFRVFSWWKWLDPLTHLFSGDYTEFFERTIFFEASFVDYKWKIEPIGGDVDCDDYMSIKNGSF